MSKTYIYDYEYAIATLATAYPASVYDIEYTHPEINKGHLNKVHTSSPLGAFKHLLRVMGEMGWVLCLVENSRIIFIRTMEKNYDGT